MNLSQALLSFALLGAEWVLWLLAILSVVSVAIMCERLFAMFRGVLPADTLEALRERLAQGDVPGAIEAVGDQPGIEADVAVEGLQHLERGAGPAAEAMAGARARGRLQLERNLAFLGTLASSAPFIGLFGTVLGIIKAFHDLSQSQGAGTEAVMAGISEALVATAIGLFVAIPAVVAFNGFQRRLRTRLAKTDEIAHLILAFAKGGADGGRA